ncbi:nucleotidyl transferase AbiEii/AbiGii toxin family protein [Aequorivita nionensis]|jgi:predicted nucleotidyltransferase|uniref:nucleotidyl transferase AbiEii/AbiGii toxin family protein n=1 Tax=Aequorivita nionensis TaxID=1287690 RepID=UPI0039659E2A
MIEPWDNNIRDFIKGCKKHGVKLIMVGGGAVNFHGYQRHSADVDFWLEPVAENFKKLILVFQEMGFEIDDFPKKVKEQQQNISIKFTPSILNLEIITNFSVNKPFAKAFEEAVQVKKDGLEWRVLSFEDLIISKIKAGRPKDLLDIQELQRAKNNLDKK